MKGFLTIIFIPMIFIGFSCSHKSSSHFSKRKPAAESPKTCMDIVRTILDERAKRAQSALIDGAKREVDDWEELGNNGEVIDIIGKDLEENRKEMALLSMAILKRDYPEESIAQLGARYKSLKKLCTGP